MQLLRLDQADTGNMAGKSGNFALYGIGQIDGNKQSVSLSLVHGVATSLTYLSAW